MSSYRLKLRSFGGDIQTVFGVGAASGRIAPAAFDFHQAEPAAAERNESRVIAEGRDEDSAGPGHFENRFFFADFKLAAVDRDSHLRPSRPTFP